MLKERLQMPGTCRLSKKGIGYNAEKIAVRDRKFRSYTVLEASVYGGVLYPTTRNSACSTSDASAKVLRTHSGLFGGMMLVF